MHASTCRLLLLLLLTPPRSSDRPAGLQLGTAHVPFAAGGLPTDGRAWATYNDLARTQGAGIGFSPAGSSPIGWVRELLGLGAAAAGLTARVPT